MNRIRWPDAAGAALLAAAAGLLLLVTSAGLPLVRWSYDLLFALRPDIPVDGVMIVQMDEESHRRLGQPGTGPWNRELHARLIDQLTTLGARAVAFDVLFLGEGEPTADARLVQAAKASSRLVVAARMVPELIRGELVGWHLERPFSALAEAAGCGVVEEADEDHMVRRHYWNPQYPQTPSLAWQVANLTGQNAPKPDHDRWLNYYGPPGWIQHISYHEALGTNVSGLFSNKVVFVGAAYTVGFTEGKGTDEFRTPQTRWTGRRSPGVEIVATAYLNLARGDWLVRLGPRTECALILLAAVLIGLISTWRPGFLALTILAVFGLAYFFTWRNHVWFPWMIVVAAQVPAALAWTIFASLRGLERERKSLEQRLALAVAAEAVRITAPGTSEALAGRVAGALRAETSDESAPLSVPDYEMLFRVGGGGYGDVWLVRDAVGVYRAAKVVTRNRFRDELPLDREFEGLKRFAPISRLHPNLVQIFHVGRRAGGIYYVMEAADDEVTGQHIDPASYKPKTLARMLQEQGRLPLNECLSIGVDLAAAVDFLHRRGLVHRDIKPGNIVFVNGVAKLADIGLITDVSVATQSGSDFGTPGYMPPEGAGAPSGDVYSLGKLIYEAAFGLDCTRFPDLPRSLLESSAESELFELNRILLTACENVPARRYQSAGKLQQALLRMRSPNLATR